MELVIGLLTLGCGFAGGYLHGYWLGRRAELHHWEPAIEALMAGELQYAKVAAQRIADAPMPSRWEAFRWVQW